MHANSEATSKAQKDGRSAMICCRCTPENFVIIISYFPAALQREAIVSAPFSRIFESRTSSPVTLRGLPFLKSDEAGMMHPKS